MIDLSKYKITHVVKWSDNLGRCTAEYNSELLGVQTTYLAPDDAVYKYGEEFKLLTPCKNVMDLNFWFLCLQVETARAKQSASEVASNA